LAKQPADLRSLEAALFSAREIAEKLGDAVILYFIDMAIAEAKMKNPPTTNNYKPVARSASSGSRKQKIYRSGSGTRSSSSSKLTLSKPYRLQFESRA
jgi:hypothetical protein